MAFRNGAFTPLRTWVADMLANKQIRADLMDEQDADMADGLTAIVAGTQPFINGVKVDDGGDHIRAALSTTSTPGTGVILRATSVSLVSGGDGPANPNLGAELRLQCGVRDYPHAEPGGKDARAALVQVRVRAPGENGQLEVAYHTLGDRIIDEIDPILPEDIKDVDLDFNDRPRLPFQKDSPQTGVAVDDLVTPAPSIPFTEDEQILARASKILRAADVMDLIRNERRARETIIDGMAEGSRLIGYQEAIVDTPLPLRDGASRAFIELSGGGGGGGIGVDARAGEGSGGNGDNSTVTVSNSGNSNGTVLLTASGGAGGADGEGHNVGASGQTFGQGATGGQGGNFDDGSEGTHTGRQGNSGDLRGTLVIGEDNFPLAIAIGDGGAGQVSAGGQDTGGRGANGFARIWWYS